MVKGHCDFLTAQTIEKKGKKGFEVKTPKRTWVYLCCSTMDRNEWFHLIQITCLPQSLDVQFQRLQSLPISQSIKYHHQNTDINNNVQFMKSV